MRTVSSIKWNRWSVEHIGRHNVTSTEVEEACFNEYDAPLVRSGKDGLHYVFGQTETGRFLLIVVKAVQHGSVRVVTARDMDKWERSYYNKKR